MTRFLTRTALPLILAATVAVAAISACGGDDGSTADASPSADVSPAATKAAVPKRPDVLLLIFDEWPIDAMLGPDGKIDAARYPNIAALTQTATWFPNAHTIYDSTTKAVPEILDAKYPRNHTAPNYQGHPRSVFDVFGRKGYRIRVNEEATSICPPRYCRGARLQRPGILKRLQRGRRERMNAFFDKITPGKPTLYVRHTLLPHGPYLFLPSGKQTRAGWQDPIPGMNSPPSFHDRYLTQHNEQRLRLQIGFVDHELGRLFARMKANGTFDKSLIAILPDHGIATDIGVNDRRTTNKRNIDEIAPIPLFIKAPGQTAGRIDRSYVRTIDVVPTIADILNFRMPYRADGRSAFSRVTKRRRRIRLIKRDFSGTIVVSAKSMERRRAAIRRAKLKQFGYGNWESLYTGIGPNRQLLGRQVAQIASVAGNRTHAGLAQAAAMRSVNPSSVVLPAQVAGRVTGGKRGAHRDLAVAVNGKIEAVGRSFYLRGKRQESFAMMVPEKSLHGGRNTVQVFEVVGGNSLRLLGSS
jgi:hypothetical protein